MPLSPVADLVSPSFENVPFGTEQPAPNQPRNSVLHRRILDRGDRVRYTFRIGRVTGLDAYEGKAFDQLFELQSSLTYFTRKPVCYKMKVTFDPDNTGQYFQLQKVLVLKLENRHSGNWPRQLLPD